MSKNSGFNAPWGSEDAGGSKISHDNFMAINWISTSQLTIEDQLKASQLVVASRNKEEFENAINSIGELMRVQQKTISLEKELETHRDATLKIRAKLYKEAAMAVEYKLDTHHFND